MDVLKLTTGDYVLTVRAEGVGESFRRAFYRNERISENTNYQFTGGEVISFELARHEGDALVTELVTSSIGKESYPVFFENKDYLFDVEFNSGIDTQPVIYSPLEEIKKGFISRKIGDKYIITGTANYGNEIGRSSFVLQYVKNGFHHQHTLGFEVFPIKLDYKNDYNEIVRDINKEFSALVLEVLKKTYSGYRSGDEVTNDIVWWNVFGGLYEEILIAAKLILNRPHNRLVSQVFHSKADRIKHLTPSLEEQIAEHRSNPVKLYREERKTLTVDTSENRFFKYVCRQVYRKFKDIKLKLVTEYKARITKEFDEKLNNIELKLSTIAHHPFFEQVGDFKGLKQESLVFQKASG